MQDCVGCGMCCYIPEIPELDKECYSECSKCSDDRLCLSYDQRPEACKSYKCYWAVNDLSDNLRPDKCGVMFEKVENFPIYAAFLLPHRPEAWEEPNVLGIIELLISQGNSVVIGNGPNKQILVLTPIGIEVSDVLNNIKLAQEQRRVNGGSVIHNRSIHV